MTIADATDTPIEQLVSLAGKAAVVTGGAKGIGLGIARRFTEAGALVVLGDVDKAGADAAAEELRTAGRHVLSTELDVTDDLSVERAVERCAVEFGTVDIWVNNAGVYPSVPVLDMTEADWDRVLDINLKGTFLGAREAAKRMVADGHGGVIINLASTAAYKAAGPGVAHYVSSKHGVRGLTKSLAVELGPFGIRVLAIAPTLIETPGIEAGRAAFAQAGLGDVLEQIAQREPLGRAGVADDVARIALFCACDLSSFMTGSTLAADAGDLAL